MISETKLEDSFLKGQFLIKKHLNYDALYQQKYAMVCRWVLSTHKEIRAPPVLRKDQVPQKNFSTYEVNCYFLKIDKVRKCSE